MGVGADEMNGKRKKRKKKNPDDRTAHVDLLVPEAKVRSQVADHALRWGVWGQAGGRTDSTDGAGEPAEPPRGSGRGRRANRTVLLQVCSLERVVGHILPIPAPQLARHGFRQN